MNNISSCTSRPQQKVIERVVSDPNNKCWIWQKSLGKGGYGQIFVNGKNHAAHRYSYEAFKGFIPSGMFVCHTCDNPKCVNPEHLFLGSPKDNIKDMIRKGKNTGEKHGSAKLTQKQVKDIRDRYALGQITQVELAREFNITRSQISYIVKNKRWKTLDETDATNLGSAIKSSDSESKAIAAISQIFSQLDSSAIERVMRWASDHYLTH